MYKYIILYIYEVGEGWVAGVDGGQGDEVGWEVSVAWEEGEMNHRVGRSGGGDFTMYVYYSLFHNSLPLSSVKRTVGNYETGVTLCDVIWIRNSLIPYSGRHNINKIKVYQIVKLNMI